MLRCPKDHSCGYRMKAMDKLLQLVCIALLGAACVSAQRKGGPKKDIPSPPPPTGPSLPQPPAVPSPVAKRPLPKPINVAYVEVNDHEVEAVGCFKKPNGDPLFNVAIIFAANINADKAGKPYLHLNDQVSALLDTKLEQVKKLQDQDIRVFLTIMGNHQNAGWSCFASEAAAEGFIKEVSGALQRYGLDGIDIDDEYSKCSRSYPDSLVKVVSGLRQAMPDKIISKALWKDVEHFDPTYKGKRLQDLLSYGWEMSYGAQQCGSRLSPYQKRGVPPEKLGLGVSALLDTRSKVIQTCVDRAGLGAFMVFNLTKDSGAYLSTIWEGLQIDAECRK